MTILDMHIGTSVPRIFRTTTPVGTKSSFCRRELGREVFLLSLPDAVLAGAGATHRLGAFDQAMHEVIPARHLLAVAYVAEQRAMEIAIADMADDRRHQLEPYQILLGLGDAVGEA